MILDIFRAIYYRAFDFAPAPPATPNKIIKGICHLSITMARMLLPLEWSWTRPSLLPVDSNKKDKPQIIVSMTSYPPRINEAWRAIETIMRQSVKPGRIILWLSQEEFPAISQLPRRLRDLQSRGLEIRLVPGNLKSHKKYYYAFKEFPDEYVMLADDDILYPPDTIEKLTSNITPQRVHVSYSQLISYGKDHRPLPYMQWDWHTYDPSNCEQFFGSGGGTMLMPSRLPPITLNSEMFMDLCPLADDVWLNAMCRLAGLKIYKITNKRLFPTKVDRGPKLCDINVSQNLNDTQLCRVIKQFPQLFLNSQE